MISSNAVRSPVPDQSKKHTKSTDPHKYIYIEITKKKIFLFFTSVLLLVVVLSVNYFVTSQQKQALLEKAAMWGYETPFLTKYIQARWLPREYIIQQVLPEKGFQTKLRLRDVVPKMIQAGIIDTEKLRMLYKDRKGIPNEMQMILNKPSDKALLVSKESSAWLITILWPLGLANKMIMNETSPIAGTNVNNFASTGGWSLGKEETGGIYFNSTVLIPLTKQQEERVKNLADTIFRPCCNNSSFFQDCNHGSAALGVVELGVSQNLTDEEIYKTVLVLNSFWFPQNYSETALYMRYAKNQVWNDIDPKIILSKEYSSISGWMANVDTPAQKIPDLIPSAQNTSGCSV